MAGWGEARLGHWEGINGTLRQKSSPFMGRKGFAILPLTGAYKESAMPQWRTLFWFGCLAGCLLIHAVGCGRPASKPDSSKPSGPTPAARRVQPAPSQPAEAATSPSGAPHPAGPVAGGSSGLAEPAPGMIRQKADVGVSPKGQGYGGGLITEPIPVYFKAPQMVAFRIQIPHAMNLYRAQYGHFPKTQEEFMEKIIQENGIQLPPLPPGARYVYDPQKAAQMQQYDPADPPLFVERPAP